MIRFRPFKFKELYSDMRALGWARWSCTILALVFIISTEVRTFESTKAQ